MTELQELLYALMERSGLPLGDLNRKIEDKKESLGHLINEDVAMRLVARDLGVQLFDNSIAKPEAAIEDLVPSMNNVNLIMTVEAVGAFKEFQKKDGTTGRVVRVAVSDRSGRTGLVLWDDKTAYAKQMRHGIKISVISAYTKAGLQGEVELHLGSRGSVDILTEMPVMPNGNSDIRKGRIWKAYDPIEFKRRDGSAGKAISFLLKEDEKITKVLVWNPSDELILNLVNGAAIEMSGWTMKTGLRGEPEIHINDERQICIDKNDISSNVEKTTRLAQVQPEMSDLSVEGTIEGEIGVETTYNGKTLSRILLRDGETVIPVVFWNDKATALVRMAKTGSYIRVDGCYCKAGPRGLEINVNKWSRISSK
jgi:replication factor A1